MKRKIQIHIIREFKDEFSLDEKLYEILIKQCMEKAA